MRFYLSFLLVFLCVFATAQVPPMVIGGPQGIDVTRILARNWMSIPIYIDTPVAPLTGSGWPGKGYIIQVAKAGDTSVWQYTGQRWAKIAGASQETYTKLVTGGDVNQLGLSRQYTVSPSTYFINGVYYNLTTQQTVTSPVKTANANARIDVIALTTTGATVVQGTERPVPLKPSVGPNRLELAAIYYPAFDTVSREISEGGLTSVFRILGRDSIYFTSGDSVVAVKDSIGISKNDTATMLNPYKFTAANGLTKDSTVFRLGGSLNQNTNINLNTRRLTFIGGSDTTRFFANGSVNIGGTATDSTYKLNVNGNTRVTGYLDLQPSFNDNTAVIRNQASTDGSIMFVGRNSTVLSSPPSRNVIIDPVTRNYTTLTGNSNTLIGRSTGATLTSGNQNVFIGLNAGNGVTTGTNNVIILNNNGPYVQSNTSLSIVLSALIADSALFGLTDRYSYIGAGSATSNYINDFYFGGGHRVRFPNTANLNFYAPSAWPSKADTIGSNFTINAGRGSGTGLGGSVIFSTSSPTTSGTTLQTLSERARITPAGNLLIGTASDGAFRLDVNGGAKMDSLVVDSLYAKFGSYTGDGSVPFAPIEFRATSGNKARIDLRPASNAGWNSNWYGAITHNGNETDVLAANYGSLYLGNSFWAAGGGIHLGNTRANPSMYIRNNSNVLIGDTANTGFRFDVNGRARVRDTLTLSTTPVTADTSANDLLVINSSNGQVRRYTGDWYSVPLTGSATLDFPSTNNGNKSDLTINGITGAEEGDVVALGIQNSVNLNHSCFTAWVSAANTVTVRFSNYGTGSLDPVSATFKVKVFK
jgi:hypothetical protein